VCCLVFCVVLRSSEAEAGRATTVAAIVVVVVVLLLFLLSVCVTSYKGHMVDALASRADEGRTSLR
jgi:lipopolysaccharide export LptBFGC system permease protein LptF